MNSNPVFSTFLEAEYIPPAPQWRVFFGYDVRDWATPNAWVSFGEGYFGVGLEIGPVMAGIERW